MYNNGPRPPEIYALAKCSIQICGQLWTRWCRKCNLVFCGKHIDKHPKMCKDYYRENSVVKK